jgi:hypothetical protein
MKFEFFCYDCLVHCSGLKIDTPLENKCSLQQHFCVDFPYGLLILFYIREVDSAHPMTSSLFDALLQIVSTYIDDPGPNANQPGTTSSQPH